MPHISMEETVNINRTSMNSSVLRRMDSDIMYESICNNVGECAYLFLVPVISVFGIIGNALSFKVFVCTSFGRPSSSVYLAALSLSDTGFLLTLLLSWVGNGKLDVHFGNSVIYCYIIVYITYVCSFLSVWYVVLIMIERYIVVCHPLRVATLCSKKRSCLSVGIISLFAVLFYSQTFITSEVQSNSCSIANDYINVVFVFTYTDTLITFIIPIITVFILNIVVIISIRRFRKQQAIFRLRKRQNVRMPANTLCIAEARITSMLIVVSTMFLVTNLPSHAIRVYIMLYSLLDNTADHPYVAQAQHICNILYFSNFSINFLLYSASSKIFRKFLCIKSRSGMWNCRNSCSEEINNTYFVYKSARNEMHMLVFVKKHINR